MDFFSFETRDKEDKVVCVRLLGMRGLKTNKKKNGGYCLGNLEYTVAFFEGIWVWVLEYVDG